VKTAEKIAAALAVIAICLSLLAWPGGGPLLVLSLSFLAILYYPFGALLFNGIRLRNVLSKPSYAGINRSRLLAGAGIGLILAMLCLGMLFKWQIWPGAQAILNIGLLLSAVVLLLLLFKARSAQGFREFAVKAGKRIVILGTLAFLLFFTPSMQLIAWHYSDQPELLEAWEAHLSDPDNQVLHERLIEVQNQTLLNNEENTLDHAAEP
jgi:hypothetical protein